MPAPVSAPIQLADLAAASRPDWNRAELDGAIQAALLSTWDWPRVLTYVTRMTLDPAAAPRDLMHAIRSPLARAPASLQVTAEGAALARAAIGAEDPEPS